MNNYEAKQAARKARYAEKAKRLEAEAEALYKYDRQIMSVLPLGQPILIGHHSERRHRALLKRAHQRMNKICELNQKARDYQRRAESQNYAISSDDEDAITKLKTKLVKREAYHIEMKRINAEYRQGGFDAITGLSEQEKENLKANMQRCQWEKVPFPSWRLTNNNAEIRRVKQRIAELEAKEQAAPREAITGNGYLVTENQDDNRIWFKFDQKPIPAVCQVMKKYGFKWSPGRKAWVRMISTTARHYVNSIIQEINSLLGAIETA